MFVRKLTVWLDFSKRKESGLVVYYLKGISSFHQVISLLQMSGTHDSRSWEIGIFGPNYCKSKHSFTIKHKGSINYSKDAHAYLLVHSQLKHYNKNLKDPPKKILTWRGCCNKGRGESWTIHTKWVMREVEIAEQMRYRCRQSRGGSNLK